MNIQVERLRDGKIFTSDDYDDQIKSIKFEEYFIEVTVFEVDKYGHTDHKKLICQKQDIPLDDFKLEYGQEFGEIL